MYWLVALLLLEAVLEGLICSGGFARSSGPRKLVCVTAILFLGSTTLALCLLAWQVWVWTVPIVAYRGLNLLRVYTGRLPYPQLRTMAMRAFGWLLVAHIVVVLAAWVTSYHHLGTTLLDVLVALQLLGATILLRASTHTWQHAHVALPLEPLTDKEAPSLSVLIPARNETDELDECLRALVASDYPKLEILVLDDCSATRRTPEIIRSFAHDGVRFVQGEIPDETRWLAKNFAYDQLTHEASGDLLLFCGVDTRFAPGSLRQLVNLLEERGKDMLSVMPQRAAGSSQSNSLLQAMRYYWEICLPRRFFKRPPVLSSCWLIRSTALKRMGGFESVSRSVNPEAPLARKAVVTDAYSFVRSDDSLGIYSEKPANEQYATSVRVRYPQLHRRLELIGLVSMFELAIFLGPIIGLALSGHMAHTLAYVAAWGVALLCLLTTYGLVTVGARLADPWYGWMLMPVAVALDLMILHISFWKYEFGTVEWKGRNVCIPVMQVEPRLPKF